MLGYQFHIESKSGKSNCAANALSRVPAEREDTDDTTTFTFLVMVYGPLFQFLDQLKQENTSNPFLQALHTKAQQGTLTPPYSVECGLLMFRGRYVISLSSPLCELLLKEFHHTPCGGHAGVKRTLALLLASFYWPNMRQSIIDHIQSCLLCQQVKYSTQVLAGLLQPLPIPEAV